MFCKNIASLAVARGITPSNGQTSNILTEHTEGKLLQNQYLAMFSDYIHQNNNILTVINA